ncbi:MAG: hypothetical protein HC933_08835 [Pleurocapsa sp. SU_196_0]|nr:hypothetical protein [Pleurocapsa sp. SU_196_0]
MSEATREEMVLEARPELESTDSVEKDAKGVGFIINLVAMYALFFIFMIAIAWFGIFSEV